MGKIAKKIKIDAVKSHKKIRKIHGVPPLKFDPQLKRHAARWCSFLAKRDIFRHSRTRKYGENLYLAVRSEKKKPFPVTKIVGRAVQRWWNEIFLYDFENPGFSRDTGHFTQVRSVMNLDMEKAKIGWNGFD